MAQNAQIMQGMGGYGGGIPWGSTTPADPMTNYLMSAWGGSGDQLAGAMGQMGALNAQNAYAVQQARQQAMNQQLGMGQLGVQQTYANAYAQQPGLNYLTNILQGLGGQGYNLSNLMGGTGPGGLTLGQPQSWNAATMANNPGAMRQFFGPGATGGMNGLGPNGMPATPGQGGSVGTGGMFGSGGGAGMGSMGGLMGVGGLLSPQLQAQLVAQQQGIGGQLAMQQGQIPVIQAQGAQQLALQSPYLANLLQQQQQGIQGALALQAPRIGVQQQLVSTLGNLFGGGGGGGGAGGSAIAGGSPSGGGAGTIGAAFTPLLNQLLSGPPQAGGVNVPGNAPIASGLGAPGQAYSPSFGGGQFYGAAGQQVGGFQMPGLGGGGPPTGQTGINMPQNSIWGPSQQNAAQSAFNAPTQQQAPFGGSGAQSYWSNLMNSLGSGGMSAMNQLGPYQQAKFNLQYGQTAAEAQNQLNSMMSGMYQNWQNLDLGNRLAGLRYLMGQWGG
jgi:hypothetical protein